MFPSILSHVLVLESYVCGFIFCRPMQQQQEIKRRFGEPIALLETEHVDNSSDGTPCQIKRRTKETRTMMLFSLRWQLEIGRIVFVCWFESLVRGWRDSIVCRGDVPELKHGRYTWQIIGYRAAVLACNTVYFCFISYHNMPSTLLFECLRLWPEVVVRALLAFGRFEPNNYGMSFEKPVVRVSFSSCSCRVWIVCEGPGGETLVIA